MEKKLVEKSLVLLFLSTAVLLVSFSLKSNPFSQYLHGHDSSMFLYFGKGISEGLVPYVDMFDHKGPILFFIQYLATLLGDNLSFGIWIIEVACFAFTCFFTFKTCTIFIKDRLLSSLAIVINVGLIIRCFEGGNLSEQYALLFIAISFYLFNKLIQQSTLSVLEYIIIGITGAIVFFIRANMIALWLIYCLYLLVDGLLKKEKKELVKQVFYIFIGGVIVVFLIALYGLLTNSLLEIIQQSIIMNIKYANVSMTEKFVVGQKFIDFINGSGAFFFVVIFLLYFFKLEKKSILYKQNLLLILYFLINFYTVIISGRFYLHYLTTQLVVLIVITAQSLNYLLDRNQIGKRNISNVLVLLLFTISFNLDVFKTTTKVINTQTSVEKKYVEEISRYILETTDETDSIYVHNINANLYLLSNRFSNSKYFVLPSLDYQKFPDISQEFKDGFIDNPPRVIVVKQNFEENLNNKSNLNYQLAQVIHKRYEKVDITNQGGAFIVYRYVNSN